MTIKFLSCLVALAVFGAGAATAQTEQQRKWCYAPEATDAQTIEGCTALVQSGQFSGRDLAIILYDRGLSYENTRKFDLAMADFSQAIGLDPNYADALDDRGNVYLKLGDYAHSITDYDRAIALKPDAALFYSNRGYSYYLQAKYDAALADLDRALSLDQKSGRAYVNRALVRFARHDCQGTAEDLLSAKQLNWSHTVTDDMKAQCGSAMAPLLAK